MFRNDRTNPSGKAGDWKGGRDLARGNPSTNVSDWMNGISKGKPPNAPRYFQCYFPGEASTQVAVQCMRPLNDDGSTDTTVLGFNFYRDGVLIHQTTGVNWAATTYTHTGLTTSQTYNFSVAAYSAAGVGTMSPTHAMTPPQAASITVTGSNTVFGSGTRPSWHHNGASGQTRSGNGYIVYQIHGSGTWYVSSNPDSAPITVLTIGGGGACYSPHTPAGGAGGGAAYVNFEQTNFPVSSTGDGLHTFTIAAGASWNVASNPADGTCTNLHYNGSGWDNVTLGTGSTSAYTSFNAEYSSGGRGSNGNTPYTAHTGSGGSGNEDINRTDGHAQTLTNMATPWEGGNGGLGGGFHSSTCNRGTSGGGGGGAGILSYNEYTNYAPHQPQPYYHGSGFNFQEGTSHTPGQTLYPGKGYSGGNGYGYETSGAGGSGASGYYFQEDWGWGGINNNNASWGFLYGVGGGGGGSAVGYGGSWGACSAGYVSASSGATYGGGGGNGIRHFGNIYAPNYNYYPAQYGSSTSQSAGMCNGADRTGGGASPNTYGYVVGANGGSGCIYIRLHT